MGGTYLAIVPAGTQVQEGVNGNAGSPGKRLTAAHLPKDPATGKPRLLASAWLAVRATESSLLWCCSSSSS